MITQWLERFRVQMYKTAARGAFHKGSFYRKSLVWLLLIGSIPGLITGVFMHVFAVDRIERDLSALHQNQMTERVKNIDDQLNYLEMNLSHWAFSPRFGWDLLDLDYVYYFKDTREITTSLVVLEGSHPIIKDVELYIDRDDPVLFKTDYYKLNDAKTIEPYHAFMQDHRTVYWLHNPVRLVHKIPGGSMTPFGALIVTMNQEKIVNLLQTMTPYNEGTTFLMNDKDELIIADNSDNLKIHALQEQVRKQGTRSGTFLWNADGKNYSVSYGVMQRIDKEWMYVSAAPTTAITSPVVDLSKNILTISMTGLLIALALSWMASIRIYTPIARLITRFSGGTLNTERGIDEFEFIESQWIAITNERVNLQARLNDQLPALRTGFLHQLLQGHLYHYSEQDLRNRMNRYGWNTHEQKFIILHFQLTGYGGLSDRFPPGNEGLVTFAASNIIEELATEQFEQPVVINLHDLTIALLLMVPAQHEMRDQLRQLGEEITEKINRILKLQVTITIGRPTDSVKRISATYMDVERAAGFRKFENRDQLLDLEEMSIEAVGDESSYPFELELELLQAMRSGKQSEVEGLVVRFLEELQSKHGTAIQVKHSMLQLLGSIQHMILQSGCSTFRLFGGVNMFEQLSHIKEPGKMVQWLKERVISPFMQERDARADLELKQVVERTIAYMHEHYMSDISLESCADMAGLNSYALSRLFKLVTGVNFIDYLTELRINKAKQLLRSTDLRMGEIAEEVGYQQRYFNRIFKKHVGLTPTEYRELT